MAVTTTGKPDFARVRTALANSGFQNDYNATFQSINALIDAAQRANDGVNLQLQDAATKGELGNYQPMRLVEPDTSGSAPSLELSEYCTIPGQLILFKDFAGNASSNNITLVGAVEGVTDPVINVDFDTYKVYLSASDGLFHTW
jgi:hypothetical protein